MAEPTYIFKDGHVYTMVGGQIVASVKESEFEPGQTGGPEVEMPEMPDELSEEMGIGGNACPTCGSPVNPHDAFCRNCGTALSEYPSEEELNAELPGDGTHAIPGQAVAQVVTTPNGLKGKVLARTPEVWGEEVTVRFENGTIASLPVDKRLTFAAAEEPAAETTPAQSLEERLAAHYEQDKMSLVARGRELQAIIRDIKTASVSTPATDLVKLTAINVQATYELNEITAALDAMNQGEAEAYEAPRSIPMVQQASMNKIDASWLDGVHAEMVREASERDYSELMDTGPEAFVASLDSAQLADAATTRIMATREIEGKTAGADPTQQDAYRRMWLARVEEQRKARFTAYKDEVRKEASSDISISAPDESLFL